MTRGPVLAPPRGSWRTPPSPHVAPTRGVDCGSLTTWLVRWDVAAGRSADLAVWPSICVYIPALAAARGCSWRRRGSRCGRTPRRGGAPALRRTAAASHADPLLASERFRLRSQLRQRARSSRAVWARRRSRRTSCHAAPAGWPGSAAEIPLVRKSCAPPFIASTATSSPIVRDEDEGGIGSRARSRARPPAR